MGVPRGRRRRRRGACAAARCAVRRGLRRSDAAVGPGGPARPGAARAATRHAGRGVAVGGGRAAAGARRAGPLRRDPHRPGRRGAGRRQRLARARGRAARRRRGGQALAGPAAPAAPAAPRAGQGAGRERHRRADDPGCGPGLRRDRSAAELPDLPARPRARGRVAAGPAAHAGAGVRRRADGRGLRLRQLPGRRAVGAGDARGRHGRARCRPGRRGGPGLAGPARGPGAGRARRRRRAHGRRAGLRQGAQRAVPAVAGRARRAVAVPPRLAAAPDGRAAAGPARAHPGRLPARDPDADHDDRAATGAAAGRPRPAAGGRGRPGHPGGLAAGLTTAAGPTTASGLGTRLRTAGWR